MDGKAHHIEAEKARENGDYLEALKHTDEATLSYQKEGNIVGLCEVQSSRYLIFQHLFEQTDDRNFLILGKFAAKAGVKIAKKSEKPEALAIPLFNLAKALTLLGKHEKAQEIYHEALDALPQSSHNLPSVEADIKIHKAICSYQMGNKDALSEVQEAINMLENSEENIYEKDVWISGGYMKLAEAVFMENPATSKEYLTKARTIIDANPGLRHRKQQLEKLEQKLS